MRAHFDEVGEFPMPGDVAVFLSDGSTLVASPELAADPRAMAEAVELFEAEGRDLCQ